MSIAVCTKPLTFSYPEPDRYNQRHLIVFKMHFSITLPSAPRSSKWSSPVSVFSFYSLARPNYLTIQKYEFVHQVDQATKQEHPGYVQCGVPTSPRNVRIGTGRTSLPDCFTTPPPTRGMGPSTKFYHRLHCLKCRPGKYSRLISLPVPQKEPQSTA
jgi:hypothetical protein